MNVANRITLGRLLFSIVLFVLLAWLEPRQPGFATGLLVAMLLFVLVTATDALDGYYARKLGITSDFGRIADPAVDKIVVCGTLVFLAAAEWARPVLKPWMVVLVLGREFVINALRGFMESRGVRFGADWAGKLKMIVQCVAIPAVFVFKLVELWAARWPLAVDSALWLAHGTIWLALVLTVWSGVSYLRKAGGILSAQT